MLVSEFLQKHPNCPVCNGTINYVPGQRKLRHWVGCEAVGGHFSLYSCVDHKFLTAAFIYFTKYCSLSFFEGRVSFIVGNKEAFVLSYVNGEQFDHYDEHLVKAQKIMLLC